VLSVKVNAPCLIAKEKPVRSRRCPVTIDGKRTFRVGVATENRGHFVALEVLGMPTHETPGGKLTSANARRLADKLQRAADAADKPDAQADTP
jgi:hypothetical protein